MPLFQELKADLYTILKTVAAQPEDVRVVDLSTLLAGKFSDFALYRALEKLNNLKLIIRDPRQVEIKGRYFKQVFWRATDDTKKMLEQEGKRNAST